MLLKKYSCISLDLLYNFYNGFLVVYLEKGIKNFSKSEYLCVAYEIEKLGFYFN